MAYDGWIEFNGIELVNLSRTAQLAEALGIGAVWTDPASVQWIQDELGGTDYDDATQAPWYDPAYPASSEFAGIVPLAMPGLGDSTLTANVTEYVTNGGTVTGARNSTLSIVGSVIIAASTERGAEFGKRWLSRVLAGGQNRTLCSGYTLRYFVYAATGSPINHYNDVRTTRAVSITRKIRRDCYVTLTSTFTLTCGDPFEYGEVQESLTGLGDSPAGSGLVSSGDLELVEEPCPAYDYTPIYDPLYPALIPPPTPPQFFPDGWGIFDGDEFTRYWATIDPIEPSDLLVVPVITLTSDVTTRMVRIQIWENGTDTDDQCDPLFSAVVTYIPGGDTFYLDGEQKAPYSWDGVSAQVRRVDSLVFDKDAKPVDWPAFSSGEGLLVTVDQFDADATLSVDVAFATRSE